LGWFDFNRHTIMTQEEVTDLVCQCFKTMGGGNCNYVAMVQFDDSELGVLVWDGNVEACEMMARKMINEWEDQEDLTIEVDKDFWEDDDDDED